MMCERTVHEIKYRWWVTGPQGARFKIFPVKGRHTKDHVREAKATLRKEQDVVSIGMEWITEEEWKKIKIFFHPNKETNDFLNKKYHELYHAIYENTGECN